MSLFETLATSPTLFAGLMGGAGLVIGSFLNVVIYRLPKIMEEDWRVQCAELRGEEAPASTGSRCLSLAYPRSACPQCGHTISALENIPLLSYVLQRGRCRACQGPISPRYPLVELLSGATAAYIAWRWGFGAQALMASLLTWSLICLSFIDLDTRYLPDSITLPFLWLGIGGNLFGVFTDLESSVIGAMLGYASLRTVYHAFKFVTGKEGMGFGDFKLLGMLGAWMGWQALPVIVIVSSVVGAIVGIALITLRGADKNVPIPFGPYLACAGWIALLWGADLTESYMRWAAPE